ncbi:hypothetical protein SNOG_03059 [Parastagonospora nodorum SN15]|uniref:Carbohydrate kinase PfkB domain-containing protein n=1 Tax=Phaeosphaeria nodorum (strain SN15 / ATCC MYA-4574 / FGSC 10173) TaxID=321614 RepID=Q0UYV5_PHANO|nr:hypothetical protein SNOG_03059 [Parastagonospora nodorum SN15]EAT89790.2 hypothetical protein SNOG_03059 [Parastagonospora nodorum SN15]
MAGFPYPENVALASLLESVVRTNGGVPATIGIIDGVARVGLSPEELIRLASSAGQATTLKLSRRDLSYVGGLRLTGKLFNGGTTIASTMLLAQLAGIKIFGTGGLGGVHRGAESSMDISADLTELGRTPVTVVSSGCKSFLDIHRTLEYLETEGVGVGTFADGREGKVDFPAFWSRDSGIQSGLLFANPVPTEHAIPKEEMDVVIAEALRQADASNASGKDNTPFVLNKIKELTKGKSIPANRALIESNVKRAAIIAPINQSLGGVAHNIAKAAHLVGGSVHLHSAVGEDLSGRAALSQLEEEGMSTAGIKTLPKPARTAQYVAVNNANKDLSLAMADMSILETIPQPTISNLATSLFHKSSHRPSIFVADANWSSPALHTWLQAARHPSTTTIFEPVSTAKAIRIFPPSPSTSNSTTTTPSPLADIITPNTYELAALHDFAAQSSLFSHPSWFTIIDAIGIPSSGLRVPLALTTTPDIVDQGVPQQAIKLLPFFPTILTKLGPQGVLMVKLLAANAPELHDASERAYVLARNMSAGGEVGGLYVRLFPPERVLAPEEVVSVNGIGDTFCGALAVGLARGGRVQDIVGFAQRAAGLSLGSRESVSAELVGLRGGGGEAGDVNMLGFEGSFLALFVRNRNHDAMSI